MCGTSPCQVVGEECLEPPPAKWWVGNVWNLPLPSDRWGMWSGTSSVARLCGLFSVTGFMSVPCCTSASHCMSVPRRTSVPRCTSAPRCMSAPYCMSVPRCMLITVLFCCLLLVSSKHPVLCQRHTHTHTVGVHVTLCTHV
jgi:hypothetical protein